LSVKQISRYFDVAEPSLYPNPDSGDSRRACGASGMGGVFKITSAGAEIIVATFPDTWINYATRGGSVSNSTSFTVN
jgi:hypothetical protein